MDINRDAPVQAVAEVHVEAPPDLVWSVQSDFARWPEWNPDVRDVQVLGPLAQGTVFKWNAGGMRIVSELGEVDPPRRLAWTGRTLGLRAVHPWTFDESVEETRVRTEESFEGWLVRLFPGPLKRTLRSSLEKGLAALVAECERRAEG